jgi:CRISPR-associated protein Cmr2
MRNWQGPTLSVGVAIGHNLEDLEDLLEWARDAEKHAKSADNPVKEERRNALAVHLHPRNGPPTMIRGQWTTGIADSLQTLATAYAAGRVAHGAAFELREMARHYEGWKEHSGLADALRADVKRVLARKAPKQDPAFLNRLRTLAAARCCDSVTLKAFSEEMLVARAIAKAYVQSGRQPGRPL